MFSKILLGTCMMMDRDTLAVHLKARQQENPEQYDGFSCNPVAPMHCNSGMMDGGPSICEGYDCCGRTDVFPSWCRGPSGGTAGGPCTAGAACAAMGPPDTMGGMENEMMNEPW